MAQPAGDNGDRVPDTPQRASSDPTILKAVLRQRHWQNYTMFTRAYQNAAKALDKNLINTYPSLSTFRRWLAGQVHDLPHAEHCTVLEAMLPGWTATELFQPPQQPDDTTRSTPLQELLQRHHLHHYPQFCRAYDITAATIDQNLVGTHPTEPQFHQWIGGHTPGPPQPASPDQPDPAARDDHPESSGTTGLVMPDQAATSAATALTALALPDHVVMALLQYLDSLTSSLITPQDQARAYHELVQLLRRWAHTMDRRNVLRFLYRAALVASAAGTLNWDEHERVVSVLSGSSRIDIQTLRNFETILQDCKRQDDVLGPRGVLDTVLIQRDLLHSLRPDCPTELLPRLLSVLSNASSSAGWLSFNLNDVTSAAEYYEDARVLAHEAGNIELSADALGHMSFLAINRGKPCIGIDHAVAAQQYAGRSDDMRLRALCADDAARAYAADGQRDACLAALDMAATALGKIGDQTPGYIRYIEEVHLSKRAECHLQLGDAHRAIGYGQQALATLDPAFSRSVALTSVDLARAYARSGEVNESARLLGAAGDIAARNSSTRLVTKVQRARAELQPWQDTTAVRELDNRLTTYGLA